jgi:hypothetical protein
MSKTNNPDEQEMQQIILNLKNKKEFLDDIRKKYQEEQKQNGKPLTGEQIKQLIDTNKETNDDDYEKYEKETVDTFMKLFKNNIKTTLISDIPYKIGERRSNKSILLNNVDDKLVPRNNKSIFEILQKEKDKLINPSTTLNKPASNSTIVKQPQQITQKKNSIMPSSSQTRKIPISSNKGTGYVSTTPSAAESRQLSKNTNKTINNDVSSSINPDKLKINEFVQNPSETLRTITSKPEQQPSRKSTASLSRPTTPRQSSAAASLSESDCTTLGLMPELGDIRTPSPSMRIPEIYKFLLSNKRYCYHIMRNYSSNDFLIKLINYLYNKSQKLPPIKPPYEKIEDFPGINDIFDRISIQSSDNLEQYIQATSKKNVLFTIISKSQLVVPRILSNHVLVSYMNKDIASILYKSIPYETIILPNPDTSRAKTVILNYQHMQFPPSITPGTTNQVIRVTNQSSKPNTNINSSISGSRRKINGGKKTIRKYRKHNRNKTTRNYN